MNGPNPASTKIASAWPSALDRAFTLPRIRESWGTGLLCLFAFAFPLVTGATRIQSNASKYYVLAAVAAALCFLLLSELRREGPLLLQARRVRMGLLVGTVLCGYSLILCGFSVETLLLALAAPTLVLVFQSRPKSEDQEVQKSLWLVAGFTVMAVAASFFSFHQHTALMGHTYRRTGLSTLLACLLVFWSARQMLRDHHQGVVVLKLLLFSGFITSALALAQFFLPRELTGAVFPPLLIDPRPFGTAGHPNWFGTYLVLLLPFAIHFLLKEWRWRWAVLVGLLHASLLVCQTRGAWLAEAVLIVFTVGIWRQDLKKLAGLFGILTLVTALLLPAHNWKILTRASSLAMEAELAASGSERAGSKRFGVWKYGLEHLPRYSLLGAGLDSFGALAEDGVEAPNSKAHSIYLEYALTTGIIGLLCYLGFLWRCFWTHAPPDFMWTFRTMLIAYLFQGIFIHDTVQTWPILWLLAGLCLGPLADGPDKAPERVRCSFAR